MNRGELREYFKDILNRSDCSDAQADRFINLGIRKLERVMRVPTMERSVDYVSDGTGKFPIPSNYLEVIGLYYDNRRLERVTDSDAYRRPVSGNPSVFWREGPDFQVRPIPPSGDSILLRYYSEFEELGADNYETIELGVYSDCILYAALIFAADFFVDERKPLFEMSLAASVTEAQSAADRDEVAGRDIRISSPFAGIDY